MSNRTVTITLTEEQAERLQGLLVQISPTTHDDNELLTVVVDHLADFLDRDGGAL